jgi:predicted dehydrogenase
MAAGFALLTRPIQLKTVFKFSRSDVRPSWNRSESKARLRIQLAGRRPPVCSSHAPEKLDIIRTCFEAFARAAEDRPPFPVTPEQIIHGASVSEAIIRSAKAAKSKNPPNSEQQQWTSARASAT